VVVSFALAVERVRNAQPLDASLITRWR
jgi:hypothetical protein